MKLHQTLRRKVQRVRNRPCFQRLQEKCMDHRRSLKKTVCKSKLEAFKELRDSAYNDIWGKSYRLVMTKVKGPQSAQLTDRKLMEKNAVTGKK